MLRVALLFAVMVCANAAFAEAPKELKVGDPVPDMTLKDQDGNDFKLSSLKDKQGIVLYFYPKADTPGCTKESCGFRDDQKDINDKGYAVYGVSRDLPKDLKAFIEKFKMGFGMLSDPKGDLAAVFGFKPGERKTAVIGKDGKLEHLYVKVDVMAHPKEVLENLGK